MSWVIDSSGWIEYFAGGEKSEKYAKLILGHEKIFTPSLILFEVYRKIKKSFDENEALAVITQIHKTEIIPLDAELSLYAADLSLQHQLGMADAIVYATALLKKCRLATSDNDFRALPEVVLL